MTRGMVADLKRFAVHDGPGIRSTLFLKGCSLRCLWCHNPETVRLERELAFFPHKCIGCGDCATVCPAHVHVFNHDRHFLERQPCTCCGQCAESCPADALRIYGRELSPEEAAELLLEDGEFFTDGGGVTLSGGEPLLQADFCSELARLIKGQGVHLAIDTCGNVPWASVEKLVPYGDLFLYDVKEIDSAKHRRFTGSGNELILDNLRRLDAAGKTIEIRMIQVPGLNMEDADLQGAAEFLSQLKHVTGIRLLPYHALARSKYEAVAHPDTMPRVETPDDTMLRRSAAILRQGGCQVLSD